ncbi:MAG TPA: ABC transporter permease [Bacteroidia bacterium]|nr:ABC transporter permease [Bacteroidia bacterium]HRH08194.1 ABC transporter permease [Bacteroidia bacterium]HRH63062.1 ABC transporter permease [Bacteroidia bacterium]
MNFYLTAVLLGLCLTSLGLGLYISMRIFSIPDITTDGSYTLGAAITGALLSQQYPFVLALVITILSGAFAGILTGIIHTRLKVNALLSGILVMTALYSINLLIMGKSNIPLVAVNSIFTPILTFVSVEIYQLLIVLLVVAIVCIGLYWLLKTDFGIAMRASGNNEIMVQAQGINASRMKIIGLGISNSLVALSGFLVAQLQGFADINMGIGIVILGLGAVMIGETLLQLLGKKSILSSILAVVAGSIVFRLILAFTLSLGINPNLLKLITSLIVLLFVAAPSFRNKGKLL